MASNPMLSEQYFRTAPGAAPPWNPNGPATGFDDRMHPYAGTAERTMTMGGTVSATGVLLLCVLAGAAWGWKQVAVTTTTVFEQTATSVKLPVGLLIGSILVAFVLSMVSRFKPPLSQYLGIPYGLAEGVALGIISHAYDVQSKGIAIQAVLATFGVFAVMLVLYSTRVLRATPKFVKGVLAATIGIGLMYVFALIFSLFGSRPSFLSSPTPLGIGISVVIVIVAALNLIIDFDFVERGSQAGLPRHMEWFAAIGLVVTIVWLYLEMLRLLSKLQRR